MKYQLYLLFIKLLQISEKLEKDKEKKKRDRN